MSPFATGALATAIETVGPETAFQFRQPHHGDGHYQQDDTAHDTKSSNPKVLALGLNDNCTESLVDDQ